MASAYSFRPRLWVLAAAAAACAAGIALGLWQSGRAAEKRALAGHVERVTVRGSFDIEHTVLLDNKVRRGRAGYEVVTPLKLAGSEEHVLVNRGWIAAPARRDISPVIRTPGGAVEIEGVQRDGFPRILNLQKEARGQVVRQTIDLPAFAAETRLRLQPRVIEQHSATDDGLLREWPRADAGAEKHESYALQWYSLASLAVALGIIFSFRRVPAP